MDYCCYLIFLVDRLSVPEQVLHRFVVFICDEHLVSRNRQVVYVPAGSRMYQRVDEIRFFRS